MNPVSVLPSIADAVDAQRRGRLTATALIESARDRAARHADLNALASVDWEQALAEAAACDREAAAGSLRGPLHGVPVSIKDLFKVRGHTMRAGTRARLPVFEQVEARAVGRLREAGALIFATTQMHEIALGATGENEWTGDVKNPFDPARQSGGSSSGAGVAVASGIGLAALGSDTGGSVRIPANFCGVVGFKPSFGAVSLEGALPLSWSFDHAGPLARGVDDARWMFEVLSGRSTRHGAVARRPRLAVPRAWLAARLDTPVREVFERTLATLAGSGAELLDVAPAALDRAWTCYTPIVRAEAAYVHRQALADGGQGFSASVSTPMRDGQQLPAQAYLDAQRQAHEVRAELSALLASVDAMMLPTAAILPPLRGQADVRIAGVAIPVRQLVLGQTLPFNVAGVPALTLPMGRAGDLPVGLQIVGAFDADARVLALARWCEERLAAPGAR